MKNRRLAHLLGAASLVAFAGGMTPHSARAQVERVTPADLAPLPSFFKGQPNPTNLIPRPRWTWWSRGTGRTRWPWWSRRTGRARCRAGQYCLGQG